MPLSTRHHTAGARLAVPYRRRHLVEGYFIESCPGAVDHGHTHSIHHFLHPRFMHKKGNVDEGGQDVVIR